MNLQGRNLLKETDLTAAEFGYLVDLGGRLRMEKRMGLRSSRLAGRNIALIFEKTSTRTRSAFEVAAHDEGAHVTYLGPGESQLGHKESVKDTARVLGRMFDGIEYRGSAQEAVETLGGLRRSAGVERPHRRLAPHPDAGRHPDHARLQPQATRRDQLLLPRRRPEQHRELAAGDRGHARHGRADLRPRRRCSRPAGCGTSPASSRSARAPGSP